MKLKGLEKELNADIRNKLTLPKTILELGLKKNVPKKPHIKKAMKELDRIPRLVEKYLKKIRKRHSK